MKSIVQGILICLILGSIQDAKAQCTAIRQQRNITFNTSGDCAPVDVTDYTITYFFNAPQDPNDIVIRFEWNDPGNSVDEFRLGDPEFVADAGNTAFTATGTFSYPEDENCLFEPIAVVGVAGLLCETSEQTQLVSSWARDNNFGGALNINPGSYNVCFGTAVVGAMFVDNSEFNCNINIEPDNPNRQDRYTQFVYGTNHDPGNSIRDLSIIEAGGSEQILTDNVGALTGTTTMGGVSAAYFGDIVHLPFPADMPDMESLAMNAPANAANLVGNRFEITLYNWNVCNPYNGNPGNPNYDDAVQIQAYITIVEEPDPDFRTRLGDRNGPVRTVFCLGEDIYFENLTVGGFDYVWEFYDDNTGNELLQTSTAGNPTFSYDTSGEKLVRLIATNSNVPGSCAIVHEETITISPDAIAEIGIYDSTFNTTIDGAFCQDESGTLSFEIGLRDLTRDVEPVTEWRWEFYDAKGDLMESFPDGADNFSSVPITDFVRVFNTPGAYQVRLIARNSTTLCETLDEVEVIVYPAPLVEFEALSVCEGEETLFQNISDAMTSLNPVVDGDRIEYYDWDFSYDGTTFNQELRLTNNDDFEWPLDGADVINEQKPSTSVPGTYSVALRLTTANAACVALDVLDVQVHPLPEAILDSDYTGPICPGTSIGFSNESSSTQVATYELRVERPLDGDVDIVTFTESDLDYVFTNSLTIAINYQVTLIAINEFNCQTISAPILINVEPSFSSGFTDENYDPLSNNCSPWQSTFQVNQATIDLNADSYTWTVSDEEGVLDGYPITKLTGEENFHSLDYNIVNVSGRNQLYMAHLQVEKDGICVDDALFSFQINPEPSANFEVEEIDSCTYKIFRVEAQQKGLVAYDWTFNPAPDNVVQQNDIQFIQYNRPDVGQGSLQGQVSLQTSNLVNCSSPEVQEQVTVREAEEDIVINFELSKDTLQLPDNQVFFQNLSNRNDDWSYIWNFDDGQTFDGFDPESHIYNAFGTYNISLTISNQFCERTLRKTLIVKPTAPLIDFRADVLEGCRPLTVNFENLSEFAVSGSYVWEFGDGTTTNQDNPTYTYFRSGVYSVRLTGANELGTTSGRTRQFYIEVFDLPVANFDVNPKVVFIPNQETFFSNLSSGASTYQWDFGDGNSSFEFNPSHSYEEEGSYDVSLIAMNDVGCTDTTAFDAAVEAIKGGQFQAPNAFTPSKSGPSGGSTSGSGGFNDVFIPATEGVTAFKMHIFNKWGQLLFESNDQSIGWDGYYEGKLMPMDVYVYKLELGFSDGRTEVKVGDVTLVR